MPTHSFARENSLIQRTMNGSPCLDDRLVRSRRPGRLTAWCDRWRHRRRYGEDSIGVDVGVGVVAGSAGNVDGARW